MPFNYLQLVDELFTKTYGPYAWSVHDEAPWAALTKPLAECRVAMISTAAIYCNGETPLQSKNDPRVVRLPRQVPPQELTFAHTAPVRYVGERDINCIFPLTRLLELETQGVIGEVAPWHFSITGQFYQRTKLLQLVTPELAKQLAAQHTDLVLLLPL
ncbi:MAG: hypothetical protein HYY96_16300 [Candidatus Tectomicrobia bacterium]|nr:hypothetical protein [Candidatus Tectomicrobia bacterium]